MLDCILSFQSFTIDKPPVIPPQLFDLFVSNYLDETFEKFIKCKKYAFEKLICDNSDDNLGPYAPPSSWLDNYLNDKNNMWSWKTHHTFITS